jgi:response regulator of citrate/malate metabolism
MNSVYKYKLNGTLKPFNNKKRKVIFNQNSLLTKNEKIAISNQEIGKLRTEQTKNKIQEVILNWDSKERLTAKSVAKRIQMGISTVKRYWPEYQELIKHQNQEVKNRNN